MEKTYTEYADLDRGDIGKICLAGAGSCVIAVEDTLEDCIRVAKSNDPDYADLTAADISTADCEHNYGDLIAFAVTA